MTKESTQGARCYFAKARKFAMLGDEDNGEPKGDVINYALNASTSNAHVSSSSKFTKFYDFESSYFE